MSDRDMLGPRWRMILNSQFSQPYYFQLYRFLESRRLEGAKIIPSYRDIFRAFRETDFDKVRVVIIGQDPYPTPGNANGLAFGVNEGVTLPRSLVNILDEVERSLVAEARGDLFVEQPNYYYTRYPGSNAVNEDVLANCSIDRTNVTLAGWARQGVLLLNSVLTTEQYHAGAHIGKGWEQFTDTAIKMLADKCRPPTIFVLWGQKALEKMPLIKEWATGTKTFCDQVKHPIFISTHPSPLSYDKGNAIFRFRGCYHFARINSKLKELGQEPINWKQVN